MASKFFQSFRKQPQVNIVKQRDFTLDEVDGKYFNVKNTDYGFVEDPSSVAYDPILDLIAVISKDGKIQIFGKPGFVISAYVKTNSQPLQIYFIPGSFKLILLTVTDDIHLLEMKKDQVPATLSEICCCAEISVEILRVLNTSNSSLISVANITALSVSYDGCYLFLGNESTSVAIVKISDLSPNIRFSEEDIFEERFFKSHMKDHKSTQYTSYIQGAVVTILQRPGHDDQLLIGLSSGLCLIMDYKNKSLIALLPWNHHLESAAWCGGSGYPTQYGQTAATPPRELGDRLMCSFSDGSMSVWPLSKIAEEKFFEESVSILAMEQAPLMPYGPFPCKEITKVLWLPTSKGGITALIGGMPSSTYKNKITISLLRGSNIDNATRDNLIAAHNKANDLGLSNSTTLESIRKMPPVQVFDPDTPEHVCFELSSNLLDAVPIGPVCGPIQGLFLLCFEEVLLIDLESDGWPLFKLPYMNCIQSSPIISMHLAADVNPHFLAQLESYSKTKDQNSEWSNRTWPIQGGEVRFGDRVISESINDLAISNDVLFTGHQSGHVNIWRIGPNGCLRHLYSLNTTEYFENEFGTLNQQIKDSNNDPWPPFKAVGSYDPYFDDERAGIKQINLVHNTLIVGTVTGMVTVWRFSEICLPINSFSIFRVNLVPASNSFSWKGPKALKIKTPDELSYFDCNDVKGIPDLSLSSIIQITPPGSITALSAAPIVISNNNEVGMLIGIGTIHGYTVIYNRFDIIGSPTADNSADIILKVCTLPLNLDAMKEAGHGESWASRRSKYLKQSLRDSFRRLKRNKSTNKTVITSNNQDVNRIDTTPKRPLLISESRAGIRRTVTSNATVRSNFGASINPNEILDAGQIKAAGGNPEAIISAPILGPEREITDRPAETAGNAIVKAIVFSNLTLRRSLKSLDSCEYPLEIFGTSKSYSILCSLYVGTASGTVTSYQLFGTDSNNYRIVSEKHKELSLSHKAPVVSLSVLGHGNIKKDAKTHLTGMYPSSPTSFLIGKVTSNQGTPHTIRMSGYLSVVTEEQVRLYLLPGFSAKYKNRITAKEGYRIRMASILHCPVEKPNSVLSNPYHVCFVNNGGFCTFLEINSLKQEEAMSLVDENNNFALSSLFFSQQATYSNTQISPSIGGVPKQVGDGASFGIYLSGPGQIVMFDVCSIQNKNKDGISNYRIKSVLVMPVRKPLIDQSLAEKLLFQEEEEPVSSNMPKGMIYSARGKSHMTSNR